MNAHHAIVALALAIVCAALPAAARWPDDPSQNLMICDRPDFQYGTRILPAPGDGWYIAWVDRSGGGRDIYFQRLDAAGNMMWPVGGILAFHDVRAGINQIVASRISPDGQPVWGAEGVQLTDNLDEEVVLLPRIAITDDDEIRRLRRTLREDEFAQERDRRHGRYEDPDAAPRAGRLAHLG